MLIKAQNTPNPNCIKFEIDGEPTGLEESTPHEESLLAKRLAAIAGVKSVLIMRDFVSVTKNDDCDWYTLKPLVTGAILEHLSSAFKSAQDTDSTQDVHTKSDQSPIQEQRHMLGDDDPMESQIISQIKAVLESKVRPALELDGGGVLFKSFNEGILKLELRGACVGCPSATATLKYGIENMMKYYIPEVTEVQSV